MIKKNKMMKKPSREIGKIFNPPNSSSGMSLTKG